jgi:hypothetical protein
MDGFNRSQLDIMKVLLDKGFTLIYLFHVYDIIVNSTVALELSPPDISLVENFISNGLLPLDYGEFCIEVESIKRAQQTVEINVSKNN